MVSSSRRSRLGRRLGGRQRPRGGSRAGAAQPRHRASNPVNFSNTVRPGDHFSGSVTFTGGGSYTLVLKDTTRGWSHTVHKTLAGAANSSAEVIAEAPCCTASGGVLPLANFGTVNFSNATANGSPIGSFGPTKINMVGNSGRLKDRTPALSGGGSFSDTWLRAN
jgi:peptidase A4-like protein